MYIGWITFQLTNWGSTALNTTFTNVTAVSNVSLAGGANGSVATVGQLKLLMRNLKQKR